jgi:hypothetical protein
MTIRIHVYILPAVIAAAERTSFSTPVSSMNIRFKGFIYVFISIKEYT